MGFIMDGLEAEAYDRTYSDRQLIARIIGYFRPKLTMMLFVAVLVVLSSLLDIAFPDTGFTRHRCSSSICSSSNDSTTDWAHSDRRSTILDVQLLSPMVHSPRRRRCRIEFAQGCI